MHAPGFYGKLPLAGDFIHRRLDTTFINRWDEWLLRSLAESKNKLGDHWLNVYLTSPMWRFLISPTLVGESAYMGIMIPSVDSVGRYFPLTTAVSLAPASCPATLSAAAQEWFQDVENICLDLLDGSIETVEDFEMQLKSAPPDWADIKISLDEMPPSNAVFDISEHWRFESSPSPRIAETLSSFWLASMVKAQTPFSLWWSEGSELSGPSCLLSHGLPNTREYTAMLDGSWREHGWHSSSLKTAEPIGQAGASSPTVSPRDTQEVPVVAAEPAIDITAPRPQITAEDIESAAVLPATDAQFLAISDADGLQLSDVNPIQNAPSEVQPAAVNRLPFSYAITNTGNVRERNEDAFLEKPSAGIWLVADGMGGHHDGALASNMTVNAIEQMDTEGSVEQIVDRIKAGLDGVNRNLRGLPPDENGRAVTCGSTVVSLVIRDNRCAYIWAGDSRLYLLREGALKAVTSDHSLIQDLINTGKFNEEDAQSFPQKNVITRAIGGDDSLILDIGYLDIFPGDRLLLCSDGLYGELSDEELQQAMATGDVRLACETLIQLGLARDGTDNITAIVVDI